MLCFKFKMALKDFHLKKLNSDELKKCEKHLSECGACKIIYDDEKMIYEKLASVKKVQVPENYWENYWPILQSKIENSEQESFRRSLNLGRNLRKLIPVAATFMIIFGSFWVGRKSVLSPKMGQFISQDDTRKSSNFWAGKKLAPSREGSLGRAQLISQKEQDKAHRVFQELFTLFPKHVKSVTLGSGDVNFRVSSTPYPDHQVLQYFVVMAIGEKIDFSTRILVRPGEKVSVVGPWNDRGEVGVHLALDLEGQSVKMICRITAEKSTASLESSVSAQESKSYKLGTVLLDEKPVSIEIKKLPVPSFNPGESQ